MLNKTIEIFPGLDLRIESRTDKPSTYIIRIENKKLKRSKVVNFHADIAQVSAIVAELWKLRNEVFERKFPPKK